MPTESCLIESFVAENTFAYTSHDSMLRLRAVKTTRLNKMRYYNDRPISPLAYTTFEADGCVAGCVSVGPDECWLVFVLQQDPGKILHALLLDVVVHGHGRRGKIHQGCCKP
jgi:hypothetical protein